MGRPKGSIFEELGFQLLKDKRKYCAFCGLCGKTLKNTAAFRLKAHRNSCKRFVTEHISEGNFAIEEAQWSNPVSTETSKIQSKQEITSPPSPDPKTMDISLSGDQVSMDNFPTRPTAFVTSVSSISSSSRHKVRKTSKIIHGISAREREEIKVSLGKLFFGCNLPLRVVESSHFKNFIHKLRPAYSYLLPDKRELATSILDSAYEDYILKSKDNVKPESVLIIDRWINSAKLETAVAMIHTVNGCKVFVDAWDLSDLTETQGKCPDIIGCSIEQAKRFYNTNIYAVVSDSASSLLKMDQSANDTIWCMGCSYHAANLLAQDLISNSLTEKVSTILNEFRRPDIEKALIARGGRAIKLPCEGQWCSYRDSYLSLIDNLDLLRQFSDEGKMKQIAVQLLFPDKLIERVKDYIELLSPICNLINMCQMDSTSVADAVNVWLQLRLSDKFQRQFEATVEMRKSMVLNDYALTSFYLHPFYNNSHLSEEHKQKIYTFLFNELNGKGIEEWSAYKNKEGIFKILYEKNIADPSVFWSMAALRCHKLPPVAMKLLNIPASTAQIERLYSRLDHIHNSNDTGLTFEQSKKLMHVYYGLGINDNQDNCGDDKSTYLK